jgi:hypothetical protein
MSTAEGAKGIIRDGLIAYWDAANYLSNPAIPSSGFNFLSGSDYEWIDMIGNNRLYNSSSTVTLTTANTPSTPYNLGGIFKSLETAALTLTNKPLTGSLASPTFSSLTFEIWMRITDSNGLTSFMANNSYGFNRYNNPPTPPVSYLNFFVYDTSSNVINANASESYGRYPTLLANTPPVHVVGTYDGQTARIYTNGTLSPNSSSFASPNTLIRNSATGSATWRFWYEGGAVASRGYVYVIRVYNRALSDQEVQQNYLSQAGRFLGYNINP